RSTATRRSTAGVPADVVRPRTRRTKLVPMKPAAPVTSTRMRGIIPEPRRRRPSPPASPAAARHPLPLRVRRGLAWQHAGGRTVGTVGPRLGNQIPRPVQRLEGAGVGPPAVEQLGLELAAAEVPIVHVGDLELAPRRWLERPDYVE